MATIASISRPAPDFGLPDLDGNLQRLSDQLGRVMVINFWSARCPWVERVDESLVALIATWPADVVYWAIASNADETHDLLATVAAQRNIPSILLDGDQAVADLYGVITTPHFCVVDRHGILRFAGAFDDVTFRQKVPTRSYLEEAVAAILAGGQPDMPEVPPYGCTLVRSGS